MAANRDEVLAVLGKLALPDGGTLVSRDLIRALVVDGGRVSFVIEAESPAQAQGMGMLRMAAEAAVRALPGVDSVSAVLTAHGPQAKAAPPGPPPSITIGRHPHAAGGAGRRAGRGPDHCRRIGQGGVGKSTVSANLAVALARAGRRSGCLMPTYTALRSRA